MKAAAEAAPVTLEVEVVTVTTPADKTLITLPLAEITQDQVLAYDPVTEPIHLPPLELKELQPA
jgi:hypothetical protein